MKPNFLHCLPLLFCFFFVCLINSAKAQRNKSGVEKGMSYYDHLIQKLDADSIAWLYTPDGKLGEMAQGRDSIKAFLSTFKNIQVLLQKSTSDSIIITNDTAIQKGFYVQKDVVNNKDTITVKGTYTARWQWMPNDGWHIKKMETQPVK